LALKGKCIITQPHFILVLFNLKVQSYLNLIAPHSSVLYVSTQCKCSRSRTCTHTHAYTFHELLCVWKQMHINLSVCTSRKCKLAAETSLVFPLHTNQVGSSNQPCFPTAYGSGRKQWPSFLLCSAQSVSACLYKEALISDLPNMQYAILSNVLILLVRSLTAYVQWGSVHMDTGHLM
jgi:hypothetical protein